MDRNPRNQSLLTRLSAHNPFAELAHRVFKVGSSFDADIAAIGADKRWSADHKRERARERVLQALGRLDEAVKPIDAHRRETANLRAGMRAPSFDKGDLVAALNRQELRTAARAMNFGQRAALMSGPDRDTDFVDAVLEKKPCQSGFDMHNPNEAELYTTAKESRVADLNPSLLATLEARGNTESEIQMIVDVIRTDITSAAVDLARAA